MDKAQVNHGLDPSFNCTGDFETNTPHVFLVTQQLANPAASVRTLTYGQQKQALSVRRHTSPMAHEQHMHTKSVAAFPPEIGKY